MTDLERLIIDDVKNELFYAIVERSMREHEDLQDAAIFYKKLLIDSNDK